MRRAAGSVIRYAYLPAMLAVMGVGVWLVGQGASYGWLVVLLLGAIALSYVAESLLPYSGDWNRSHDDSGRDWAHALVNETLQIAVVASVPLLAHFIPGLGLWPDTWPFLAQVGVSILVLDFGIATAHFYSHRWSWLWRFHAVHHSVKRMYGLNGLMKHPVHQLIETSVGAAPLLVLGLPQNVAATLAFCVSVQLLLQHSNAAYAAGPLRWVLAINQVHRFHHVAEQGEGDVNFGLFTNVFDHLVGCYHYDPSRSFESADLGIDGRPAYPARYAAQLREPFRAPV